MIKKEIKEALRSAFEQLKDNPPDMTILVSNYQRIIMSNFLNRWIDKNRVRVR